MVRRVRASLDRRAEPEEPIIPRLGEDRNARRLATPHKEEGETRILEDQDPGEEGGGCPWR